MKKFLTLLLAALLLLSLLASCTPTEEQSKAESTANSEVSTEESKENSLWKYDPNIPEGFDFTNSDGKAEIVILTTGGDVEAYHDTAIGAEEMNDELINDAVYTRNAFLEDVLGVKVVCEYDLDVDQKVTTILSSSIDQYDVVLPFMNEATPLVLSGYFVPLNSIETLQLEKEWWDQRANEQLSIGDKLYFTTGDISMLDNDCTQAIMFNLDVVTNFDLESPYKHVKDGTWTMDVLKTMAKTVTAEGASAYTDMWGFHINNNGATGLYISGGQHLVTKDGNDLPILGITSENASNVVDKIKDLMTDKSCTIIIEDYNAASQADGFYNCYRAAAWAIAEGKALFRYMSMSDTLRLADYKACQYGILPSPKFSADQDGYASLVSTLAVPAVCIPNTNDDYERIGVILDAMAAKAKEVITNAYYDVLYQFRVAPDDESREILDIIFAERTFDLGVIFSSSWNNIGTIVNSARTGDWTSLVDSQKDAMANSIQTTVDKFETMD